MKQYQIGYTTGVFDMFHIGHLNILRRAKEQCEYLIVGVSTDELVWEYKQKVPVIGFESRIEIVKAIRYVDRVVVQETMDKYEAWKRLQFDVVFHGSDWKDTAMYDYIVKKLGGVGVDVVFLPYTQGISSTVLHQELDDGRDSVAEGNLTVRKARDAEYKKELSL